jgi:glycerol uptake facilitator-like aquaporin
MQEFPINFLALSIAAFVKFFLGWLWYSPVLFAKPWMRLAGIDCQSNGGVGKAIFLEFLGSFVMAFVLLHAVHYAGATTAAQGAAVGFFNWIGFIAVATMGGVLFEKRPLKLYLINVGLSFVALPIMGVILATV